MELKKSWQWIVVSILAVLAAAFGLVLVPGGTTPDSPEEPPIIIEPEPENPGAQVTFILDGFERPEFAFEGDWKPRITRTLLEGQVTSVIAKSSDPCSLVPVEGIQKMIAQDLTRPSAPSYRAGRYYDPLVPLTAGNCADAEFLQIDVSHSISLGDAAIVIEKKRTKLPSIPTVPLHIEFNNWTMVRGYCGGVWCPVEPRARQGAELLNAHRVSPYKQHATASVESWNEFVAPYVLGQTFVESDAFKPYVRSLPISTLDRPFAYVHDEPKYYNDAQMLTKLRAWRDEAPTVARMVTTPIRRRDLNPQSPTYGSVINHTPEVLSLIDIFAPVAEEFCVETWVNSRDFYPCRAAYTTAAKRLWLYVSNMSHGADGGPATGAPDLVIDRSAVEVFGFFLLALKYDAEALLYYNSIEGWELRDQDIWANPYIFGGNGDGLLLYPDREEREARASIRLKLIREASQWADVIRLAGLSVDHLMENPLNWDRDLREFESLYIRAMEIIR